MSEFEKERKEHPTFTDKEIHQIVKDHEQLKAMGLEDTGTSWRYNKADDDQPKYVRTKVSTLGVPGIQVLSGQIKGANSWQIRAYIFDKKYFKTPEAAKQWLEQHLKKKASSFLDLKTWSEYNRRCGHFYMENSTLK